MATPKQLAKHYIERLKVSKQVVVKSASADKTAGVAASYLKEELISVMKSIDSIAYSDTKLPVDEKFRNEVLTAMDDELGLEHGSFQTIKKGAVEMGIKLDQYVQFLMTQVEFE